MSIPVFVDSEYYKTSTDTHYEGYVGKRSEVGFESTDWAVGSFLYCGADGSKWMLVADSIFVIAEQQTVTTVQSDSTFFASLTVTLPETLPDSIRVVLNDELYTLPKTGANLQMTKYGSKAENGFFVEIFPGRGEGDLYTDEVATYTIEISYPDVSNKEWQEMTA